jgi:hypothetical protein
LLVVIITMRQIPEVVRPFTLLINGTHSSQ